MKLDMKKFGLAGGVLWAVGLFVWTIIAIFTGWGQDMLYLIGGIYPWYSISLGGAVIGLIWGFFDGFVGCWLFAWLYNKLAR